MNPRIQTQSHFISAPDGLRLHVRSYEPGVSALTPVVCLPGLTRNSDDFEALAEALAQGAAGGPRRVIALDYRGRGLSEHDSNWRNYDLKVENADILACLTALEIGEAAFVGTSRGGLHVMMFAITRPAMLRGAVLNDIGPVIEAQGLARIRSYVGKLPTPHSWADAVDLAKSVMGAQFSNLNAVDWDAYARGTFMETDGKFQLRYDPALMRTMENINLDVALPTAWPQFEGLSHIPLLALRGANSDLLSPQTLEQMQARHSRCEAHIVEGQGHAPLLRDAPTIARIGEFLRDL